MAQNLNSKDLDHFLLDLNKRTYHVWIPKVSCSESTSEEILQAWIRGESNLICYTKSHASTEGKFNKTIIHKDLSKSSVIIYKD